MKRALLIEQVSLEYQPSHEQMITGINDRNQKSASVPITLISSADRGLTGNDTSVGFLCVALILHSHCFFCRTAIRIRMNSAIIPNNSLGRFQPFTNHRPDAQQRICEPVLNWPQPRTLILQKRSKSITRFIGKGWFLDFYSLETNALHPQRITVPGCTQRHFYTGNTDNLSTNLYFWSLVNTLNASKKSLSSNLSAGLDAGKQGSYNQIFSTRGHAGESVAESNVDQDGCLYGNTVRGKKPEPCGLFYPGRSTGCRCHHPYSRRAVRQRLQSTGIAKQILFHIPKQAFPGTLPKWVNYRLGGSFEDFKVRARPMARPIMSPAYGQQIHFHGKSPISMAGLVSLVQPLVSTELGTPGN
jgi:hypothetical protein